VIDGRELEGELRAEVGKEAALAQVRRLCKAADRERLEPFLGGERGGDVEDRLTRPLTEAFEDRLPEPASYSRLRTGRRGREAGAVGGLVQRLISADSVNSGV